MPHAVIVYHSGFGHTKAIADSIGRGVGAVDGATVAVHSADDLPPPDPDTRGFSAAWDDLDRSDLIVFGSPTYMGTVSAPFKAFMDAASGKWLAQAWRDKLAAGFTVSGSLSGDKLNTLLTLATFAAQQGMVWVPMGVIREEGVSDRIGSTLGLMAQADNAPADQTPPEQDHRTARAFGARLGRAMLRWAAGRRRS